MCKRNEGEALLPYLLRYIQEQPRVVMAFVGMFAAVGVYVDHRGFVLEQVQAMREVSAELRTINARLEHLEREHEASRSNTLLVTPKLPPAAAAASS